MKPKLYNVLFPIWVLIFLPPILFLFLLGNGLLIFLLFTVFKKIEKKQNLKNVWIRLLLASSASYIFMVLLLLIPQLLGEHSFIYEHFAYPLSTNPWQDSFAIIYLIVSFLISLILFCLMIYYFILKNIDLTTKRKKLYTLLFAIFSAPYLFFLPSTWFYPYQNNELESYYGITLIDSNVKNMIDLLDFKGQTPQEKIVDQHLTLQFPKEQQPFNRMQREELASYLFHLIQDVDTITFEWEESFSYTFSEINQLYNQNLRDLNINVIQMRYHTNPFLRYTYLGHIDRYDLFINTNHCEGEIQTVSLSGREYQVEGFCPNQLEIYEHNKKYQLETLLEKEELQLDEIKQIIDNR